MEKLYYELKPFLCVYLGAWAARTYKMWAIGVPAAYLLVICGLLILATRVQYRILSDGAKPKAWDGRVKRADHIFRRR